MYKCKTTRAQRVVFERVMRLELTISCLGSKRSTTELHPLDLTNGADYTPDGKGMSSIVKIW